MSPNICYPCLQSIHAGSVESIPKPLSFGVKPILLRRDPGCARKARDPGLRSGTPLAVEDGDFRGLYSPTYWVAGEARAGTFVVL